METGHDLEADVAFEIGDSAGDNCHSRGVAQVHDFFDLRRARRVHKFEIREIDQKMKPAREFS